MTTYRIPFIFSSDPLAGARNVSPEGDRFSVFFERPIIVENTAINVTVTAIASQMWNTVPNIITGVNDLMFIDHDDGGVTSYTVVIPQGLYSITELDDAVNRSLVNQGAPNSIITISGDNSTQKAIITINVLAPETIEIDFVQPQTFREILGFNSQIIGPSSGIISIFADDVAKFNASDSYLISTNLVTRGIRVGDIYNSIIMQIPITKPSGQILYTQPFYPIIIPANELIGTSHSRLDFWLTDDKLQRIDTNGENFSVTLELAYTIPDKDRKKIMF